MTTPPPHTFAGQLRTMTDRELVFELQTTYRHLCAAGMSVDADTVSEAARRLNLAALRKES